MPTKTKKGVAKKTVATKANVKTMKKNSHVVKQDIRCECADHCGCMEHCGCGCHAKCRIMRQFLAVLVVFLIGFAAARFTTGCHCKRHMGMPAMQPVFENGCLSVDSIKCPKMLEMIQKADVNKDGCISADEFDAIKKTMKPMSRPEHKMEHQPMPETESDVQD